MKIEGARTLVTGGSSGIGAALAAGLHRRGATVVVQGRDPERTQAVADLVTGAAVLIDLTDSEAVDALVAAGPFDIVVMNAGRGYSGPLGAMTAAQTQELLSLDLTCVIALTQAILPGMIARGSGHLCFVSSIAARTIVAGEAVYSAAKAGVDAFAESLRAELAGTGIGVTVVVPGVVDTEFFAARGRPYERKSPRPVPAARVALATVRAIEGDHAEVFVPAWLRVAPVVRALAPRTFRALTARFGEKVHASRESEGLDRG